MSSLLDTVEEILGRKLNDQEIDWLTAVDEKVKAHGEDSTSVLKKLLPHDDLLTVAIKSGAAPDYIEHLGRIDVAPNNDCPDRSGVCSVRLQDGYSYYDHRIVEHSANPHPGQITVAILPHGVDASWKVKFIGGYYPWGCSGERSWLDADVIVRGFRNSPGTSPATTSTVAAQAP